MSLPATTLTGTTVIITGASSGLGTASAIDLAGRGASVVMAVRDLAKGEAVAATIRETHQGADIRVELLDLADLASVRSFAERFTAAGTGLQVLMNNAGVMMPPTRQLTADGFELQFGTNHLGHVALTSLLLPLLEAAPSSRVVTVASLAARTGTIRFEDLQWERGYKPSPAYSQSKLANLLFSLELDRRLRERGSKVVSVAAHPGVAGTNLMATMGYPGWVNRLGTALMPRARHGAVSQIHAATSPGVEGGTYYGPSGPGEAFGRRTRLVPIPAAAASGDTARRLWQVSEELVGLSSGL